MAFTSSRVRKIQPRTIWSLSNAFTSAFKELDPITQFKATAKLGEFLEARFSQSFLAGKAVPAGPPLFTQCILSSSPVPLSAGAVFLHAVSRPLLSPVGATKRILSHSNVLATLSFQFKGLSVSVSLCLLRSVTLVIFPTLAPVYSAIYANCGPASQAAEYQQRRWLVGEEHMVRAGFTAKLRYGIVVTIILFVVSGTSAAHCDGMDGPVVVAARTALATGDVNRVLLWVRENDEAEVKQAFQSTLKVRSLSLEAKELADRYFFETVVRLHRTAEGAPYTGLKPAGRDLGPAIPAADRALAVGSSEHLKQLLMNVLQTGLQEHFEKAFARRNFRADDLAAGRRYVEEYVEYVHYVERVYEASVKSSQGHYLEHEESQGARTHTED